ncbi:endonuclease MutS2 [Desulfolucanica intricata]|uniref:endonuclease MutS2 n=1 Tax=Desulfolucanica intricata TaxID=1285191 RepID=UPI0008311F32|nr:endonuclease MutS2 [Desulfolucanica intricata]
MDQRTLKRLEFDKILEKLAGCTASVLGKERALALLPSTDFDTVKAWQAETTQARELFRMEPGADLGGWRDIRESVSRAEHGAVLEPKELLDISETLTSARKARKYLLEREELYPLLVEIASRIGGFSDLEQMLKKAILPGGEIADSASDTLSQIRRRIINTQASVKQRLEHIIRSPQYQKYLQDPIVTMREGRYVVPVKQEYRGQVQGIVHDTSASGATLFIEPMSVVEANNELRRLIIAEKQEVAKILTELSIRVAQESEELWITLEALGHLDFVLAKARFSRQLDAWVPQLTNEHLINIQRGRHPLLSGKVVPVSVHLGKDFDELIITGPNTGGKTVALKTIGLLVLMNQSGLHIPADSSSEMGIFNQVFADIGDEQSIEQSLSTFSSHMSNIVSILNSSGPGTLVLMDELGSGTDPTEGAALAQAILEKLHKLGAKIVATTHYSELKNFAYVNDRVENASVEFDPVSLRPTYRLLIGKPGRSNAFDIASRLGLREEVVERAKEFLTTEQIEISELMKQLEKEQRLAEEERQRAEILRSDAEKLKERYRELEEGLRSKREDILTKAYEKAQSIMKKAKLEADEVIKEIRAVLDEEDNKIRERVIQETRNKIKGMQGRLREKTPEKTPGGIVPQSLLSGEEVLIPRFNQRGYVLSLSDDGKEVQVQVGIMKLNLPINELRKVGEIKKTKGGQSQISGLMKDKSRNISTKLDLRGMRAEEAWLEVEKYLDDAFLAGLGKVYVVHGKGTGALRSMIHRQLQGNKRVKSFRLGEHGEGGAGVTVVDIN